MDSIDAKAIWAASAHRGSLLGRIDHDEAPQLGVGAVGRPRGGLQAAVECLGVDRFVGEPTDRASGRQDFPDVVGRI
jgi:hypothetical protein